MSDFWDFIGSVLKTAVNMMNSASAWMLAGFVVAGVLHEALDTERVRRSSICSTRITGVFNATVTGMFIPICSCGSIPLGIGMYYSGAYLGPTLAFMTSAPMINPIAIILSYGLLGKEIATVYLITGFVAPMIIGMVANRFGGKELYKPNDDDSSAKIQFATEKATIAVRLKNGMRWAFGELTPMVSKYAVSGMLVMGLLLNVVPQGTIQRYLGDPGFISLLGITVVAALMYVCAVGHMPFIAAVVASGAAPGVAITFLMAGAGTNLAELLTINRTIGKRSMLMYFISVVVISNIVGYLTNRMFPNFKPVFSYDSATHSISTANRLILSVPEWAKYICTSVLVGYAIWALIKAISARTPAFLKRAK